MATAELPATLVFLRVNCVRHLKFALTSLADHLKAGAAQADRRAVAALIARARAASSDVARVTRALATTPPAERADHSGGARDDVPADLRLASALLARARPTVANLIEVTEALAGTVPDCAAASPRGPRKLSS